MSAEVDENPGTSKSLAHGGVIVIAALLLVLGAGGYAAYFQLIRLQNAKAVAQVESLAMAVDLYTLDCGRIPTGEQGLAALWKRPVTDPIPTGWKGPYVDAKSIVDPWGRTFDYLVPGPRGFPFGIRSLGADGREGGNGRDRDLASWDVGKENRSIP